MISSLDVTAGGHRLRVHTTGRPDAPAIVWLHGSGPGADGLTNWEGVLPRFAGSHYSLAPDLLGFGDSDHPDPAPHGMAAFTEARARSVIALLDELGVSRAHFVGNSMGGMITLTVASLAPERVGRMVLMGSGGAPNSPSPDLMKLITFYADPTPAAMEDLLSSMVHDDGLFAGRLGEIAAARLARAVRPEVRRSHLATFAPGMPPVSFTPEQLAALPHETLVVHGREDRMLPFSGGLYLAENLPNARLHLLPHAGHWVQIEQADAFAALAALFLTEGDR
ncbi:alpha/beta fold hydrolase [Actinocorallia sp. A-T 12471]|uniref:alpha/beta fold hydrolase n=1 Tax=Actinocorallia sp. A-T 12471 TaxID=3089813 RepID=UPI0029CB13EE|nr:alpha/beta fold hydrolase [Actinocorallia sp. A-T 12471]MDX6740646.1 alpha/beta fold hydrolase [Actinocorallia sp. A-T 12471]